MDTLPNVYRVMAFDLHPRVKAFLDELNKDGQMDLDRDGHPYLVGVDREGPNFVVKISRNNKCESFILNPRRQADPVLSWNPQDGWMRNGGKQVIVVPPEDGTRKERTKRTFESFENLVNQILEK